MALDFLENLARAKDAERAADALAAWNVLNVRALEEPLPPIPWLCEGLGMAPGAVSLVAGYGYSRKTMAMQSLALSVATGRSAWGLWGVRRGHAVHLDYEQGRRLTQERYQRLARGAGIELADLPSDALRVACMPRVYLETQEAIDSLLPLVEGAAFVLVDSLRAAFPHADENSSEVRSYLDALNHVSERTGATIAVIHHARKPNAQNGGGATHAIRGSSALFDACQSVYVFEGEKDMPTKVHHQKDRVRGVTLQEFGLTSEDVDGPKGEVRWGLRVVHLDVEQMRAPEDAATAVRLSTLGFRIVELLDRTPDGMSKRAIRTAVGARAELVDTALEKLILSDRVTVSKAPRAGLPNVYRTQVPNE